MPNLYNKLMAKDMPRAAAAPTSRQMVQAPMGLRSAMKRYADGGELSSFSGEDGRSNQSLSFPQLSDPDEVRRYEIAKIKQEMDTRRPPEPARYSPPETVRPPPPEEPRYQPEIPEPNFPKRERPPEQPRYEEPRLYEEPLRPERPVMPEVYPQDYAGPRTTGTSQTQQVGPRTSYRQEADGTMTEIGYDGQPVSGYTPEQLAMHNATTGVTPSEFQYVWNGQGYDKVRTGGITMDDGTFIAGADNGQGGVDIGGPAFFQKYANDPMTMARLREMYGFTGAEPEYQQPQIGYNPVENVPPQIGYNQVENVPPIPFNPADIPTNGYNEPEVNYPMPDPQQTQSEDARLSLLKKALSGQGVGSLADSQKLTQLLRSLGYSK